MDESESLSHSKGECKYHVVFIPQCRRKTLSEQWRRYRGERFHTLAEQKERRILEGHRMPDHVPRRIASPPKYAVSPVLGSLTGKRAIPLVRVYGERKRNFVGQHCWARGYFVSTVGRDEAAIGEYIRTQAQADQRLDQLNRWSCSVTFRWPMNCRAALATRSCHLSVASRTAGPR
jgi:putative transposase